VSGAQGQHVEILATSSTKATLIILNKCKKNLWSTVSATYNGEMTHRKQQK